MRRWTSTYRFAWTPIVNFSGRRMRFLDWVDLTLDPVAFTEQTGTVGIALEHRATRMSITPTSLVIEDGAALGVESLVPALRGVFDIFTPDSMVLTSVAGGYADDLPGVEYSEARATFARRVSGDLPLTSGLAVTDCAVLLEFGSTDHHCMAEYGIVDSNELLDRLANPDMGRMASTRPALAADVARSTSLPSVAAFADVLVVALHGSVLSDSASTQEAMRGIDSIIDEIALGIYARVADGEMQHS